MAQFDNQRAYIRGSHMNGTAQVSADGHTWATATVSDISSGGLRLHTGQVYAVGDVLWFDFTLEGFLSRFEVKTKGKVVRKTPDGQRFAYGVAFEGLSRETQVRIDAAVHGDRPVARGGYEAD